ncbi:UNVERIFIED_CONTAM: Di- and tricarboxylate transporters [Acetivibrio alkalicellulosi]
MITDMQLVFFILIATTICFLVPRFRSDLVALTSLLVLFLTNILTTQEAFSGFANSVVIMIAALFVVGEGVFQTGLADRAGNMLVKFTGNSEFRMTIFMMVLVAVLSGFMSNTGTVAILLPVIVSLCGKMHISPGKLLIPLAFASSMGGTLTLIGTAPNLIGSESLINYGYEGLSFFSFTAIGSISLIIGIVYLWFIGRRMLDKPIEKASGNSKRINEIDLIEQYNISSFIHCIQVSEGNSSVGKTLKELQWTSKYDVTVLEAIKNLSKKRFLLSSANPSRQFTAGPDYLIEGEDILIVYGEKESLNNLINDTGISIVESEAQKKLTLDKSQLAEVILTPQSQLINQTIEDIHFRDKYSLTIIAIKHQYGDARRPSKNEKLLYGDTMLVHGKWKDINLLHEEKGHTVVLSHGQKPESTIQHPIKSIVAGSILLCMMLVMVFEWLPAVMAVVIAALLMLLTRCVRQTDQAYRSINWHTVILIACMLPMATALEKTGGIEFLSEVLITGLGSIGPVAVLAGLYVIASLFSQFISNTATAVLLYPVAILTAQQMGVNPVPMVMAVAFSSSMAFATPVATPPNAMVMAAGKYKFFDFLKVGMPMQIIIGICIIIMLQIFYTF